MRELTHLQSMVFVRPSHNLVKKRAQHFPPVYEFSGRSRSEYFTGRTVNSLFSTGFCDGRTNASDPNLHAPAIIEYKLIPPSLLPVARGALFRFDHIKVRGYPSNVAFGFGQTEIYDSAVHVDATYQKGVTMANGRVNRHENYPNRQIVKNDPFSDEKTVDHRWVQVMPRGVGVNPGSLYWARKWQYKILKRGETEIELQFYVTTLDLADHDPICEIQEDGRVTLREGINEWGTLLKLQLPNLLSLGFRPQDVPAFGLKDVVEMYYCLGLVNTGGNMRVKCAIMAPGTEPYDGKSSSQSVTKGFTNSIFRGSKLAWRCWGDCGVGEGV